ncbi:efflux RND transporter permease subunit [Candidatus Njordibacter sp. Uisw_058]|jgi:predicted RND superfamily exporter protein|uniref:efflux RND transporter permease subunit n=1 Tax=Candidatus Njordibacter sp. Uisw_058 TaxID=3230974 RepID=UPI003D44E43C
MRERIYNFALNKPWITLLISLLLVFATGFGAQNLVFKGDYKVFFSEQNPELTAFKSIQEIYAKSENVAFILAPKNGDIFTKDNLAAVYWLTNESWQVPYSTRVDSISNFQHTTAEADDLIVEDLVLDPDVLLASDMVRLKEIATTDPLLLNKIVSATGHVSIVNITNQLPGIDPIGEIPEVSAKVRDIKGEFEEKFPNIDIQLTGMVVMNDTFSETTMSDSGTLVPIMFGIVLLTMLLLLRSFTGTLATLIVIIFSIITTMGAVGWLGFFITAPSSSAPIMIMTLAVADCIHILTSYYFEMRQGKAKREALLESLRVNFKPILLTSVTTAIGFMSMNFSDSPPFRDLGNMVAIGVMLAFVFSITVFPALLMMLPVKASKVSPKSHYGLMERFSDLVVAKRKILLPASILVIVAIASFLPQNKLDDNFVEYFDETVPFRAATDFMEDNLSGLSSIEVSINSRESSGINDPAFLKTVGDFSEWLRLQSYTDHVNSISDVLKRLNKNMHGDDPAFYKLPEERELSAQYLLLYEMSLPYGLDLNNQLNVDKSSTRVIGTFKNLSSMEQINIEQSMYEWFAKNAPAYQISISSPTLMFAHIGQRNIYSMLFGTTVALLLISLLLAFALRSVRYGIISLLPNLIPASVGFGLWYFIDGQIGLALSVVTGMTLGIVVDDTVHFLSKYKHARDAYGKNSEEAVKYAFSSVGRALWITTLVLVAGFMVLAQSSFKLNGDMGLLTAVTIAVALIVDFLFLPPLLMLLDGKKESKKDAKTESKTSQSSAGDETLNLVNGNAT